MGKLDRDKFDFIQTPAGLINKTKLCGWAGHNHPELLREAFNMIATVKPFQIKGARPIAGMRSMLWEIGRKVLGQDTPNYPQQTSDCVSFSAKNAIEYVQFYPLANANRTIFKQVFPPYLYSCGRMFIGNGVLGGDGGSLGVWQAEAVKKYGTISIDAIGCPPYSGAIADEWGQNEPSAELVSIGKTHIVKSTYPINTWDELVTALTNGYPVTVASNVGFEMLPQADGFHHVDKEWMHSMTIIGVDNNEKDPYSCILNQWGDNHGLIRDFTSDEHWPVGTLRVRKDDTEKMLAANDSFTYGSFEVFLAQDLPRDVFNFLS